MIADRTIWSQVRRDRPEQLGRIKEAAIRDLFNWYITHEFEIGRPRTGTYIL